MSHLKAIGQRWIIAQYRVRIVSHVYISCVAIPFLTESVPMKATLLCVLLCFLVEVQSQTGYPYLTLRGNHLPNHSYVDIRLVGRERGPGFSNTVQCHTDLVTCCDDDQEVPLGDWFTPGSDTRLGI